MHSVRLINLCSHDDALPPSIPFSHVTVKNTLGLNPIVIHRHTIMLKTLQFNSRDLYFKSVFSYPCNTAMRASYRATVSWCVFSRTFNVLVWVEICELSWAFSKDNFWPTSCTTGTTEGVTASAYFSLTCIFLVCVCKCAAWRCHQLHVVIEGWTIWTSRRTKLPKTNEPHTEVSTQASCCNEPCSMRSTSQLRPFVNDCSVECGAQGTRAENYALHFRPSQRKTKNHDIRSCFWVSTTTGTLFEAKSFANKPENQGSCAGDEIGRTAGVVASRLTDLQSRASWAIGQTLWTRKLTETPPCNITRSVNLTTGQVSYLLSELHLLAVQGRDDTMQTFDL